MNTFLGLDLSLTQTGVVVIDSKQTVRLQAVVRSSKMGDKPIDELNRLNLIMERMEHLILGDESNIKFAAIEGIAYGIRKTTALAQLSALNYFTRNLLAKMEIPFIIVPPLTLKKFVTGSGKAGKEMMMLEIMEQYGETFSNDNISDAYGLALMAKGLSTTKDLTEDQICAINTIRTKQL